MVDKYSMIQTDFIFARLSAINCYPANNTVVLISAILASANLVLLFLILLYFVPVAEQKRIPQLSVPMNLHFVLFPVLKFSNVDINVELIAILDRVHPVESQSLNLVFAEKKHSQMFSVPLKTLVVEKNVTLSFLADIAAIWFVTLLENVQARIRICLLYTSDAADDTPCVDLGGRRIIKKKKKLIRTSPHYQITQER
eukprot:TRINITY_DN6825_c0_g1_i8.p5 TRINITY_DN6825_c0_g1~~TRINITY_DN6825_c0_g1_i8.p5  ORF type:complete len:198 (-),score=12.85 TRINITY_DN6825_c0_g1_i8:56-649(-)